MSPVCGFNYERENGVLCSSSKKKFYIYAIFDETYVIIMNAYACFLIALKWHKFKDFVDVWLVIFNLDEAQFRCILYTLVVNLLPNIVPW